MKKSLKVVAAAAIFASAAALSVSAQVSGLREATASTVEDDVYSLMNVIDWDKLKFKSLFGFTSIDSATSGNLYAALHLENNADLHLGWEGNLWTKSTSKNTFKGLYGWENKAIRLTFSENTYDNAGTVNDFNYAKYKNFSGDVKFGMRYSKELAFDAGLGFDTYDYEGTADDTSRDVTNFDLSGAVYYTVLNDGALEAKAFASTNLRFGTTTVKVAGRKTEADANNFRLTPGLKAQYKMSKTFTYGFYGSVPLAFSWGDGPSSKSINFNLRNGFSASVMDDSLLINAGIRTTLPSLTFPEKGSVKRGDFGNEFYAGFSFIVSPELRIDATAVIQPADGESFDEIWNQNFMFSLRVNF